MSSLRLSLHEVVSRLEQEGFNVYPIENNEGEYDKIRLSVGTEVFDHERGEYTQQPQAYIYDMLFVEGLVRGWLQGPRQVLQSMARSLKNGTMREKHIVRLRKAPDGYRGDRTCLEFIDNVELRNQQGEFPQYSDVYQEGVYLGRLLQYYGNHGRSDKLAEEEFQPVEFVEVVWID